MKTVHVTDRTWESVAGGALFEAWPDDSPPRKHDYVVIFDRDLRFTQHEVEAARGRRVRVGPARPWS